MYRRILRESCCTTPSAMGFWAATFVLVYGASLALGSVWRALDHYGDTLILGAMAAACFVNFGRNRTLHCALSGPVLLLATVVAALAEGGIRRIDMLSLWGMVLLAVGIAFLVEWRVAGRRSTSSIDADSRPRERSWPRDSNGEFDL